MDIVSGLRNGRQLIGRRVEKMVVEMVMAIMKKLIGIIIRTESDVN
jgi:flagellar biosynthesis/type III secretory pathway protein FliH